MYLKDYHRANLLSGEQGEEEPEQTIMTYDQEEKILKEAFHTSIPSDDEEDLLKRKPKTHDEKKLEDKDYQRFLKEAMKDETSQKMLERLQSLASQPKAPEDVEDEEAFLAAYLLNRGWLDTTAPVPELFEEETSDEDRANEFENQYNFRFEQPGGTTITTHSRTLPSVRRSEEKRKKERERKKKAKEEEKKRELEEIARLRNLKRAELEERIQRIEEVAGAGGWTERDVEDDFDPQDWDKRMDGIFNEAYYNEVSSHEVWN